MKFYLCGVLALFSFSALASDNLSAEAEPNPAQVLLHQMEMASSQLSYELSYILIRKNNIEPLRYRHALLDNKPYSQLLYLSGPPREIIQRGGEVSYFEAGIEPYTLKNDHMVAPFPTLLYADVKTLAQQYDFVSLGRAREAGVSCDVVRISAKDGQRYAYVVWIDQKNKLLVRADLLDRDGEPIEQYRALSIAVSPQITEAMMRLSELELPQPLMLEANSQNDSLGWKVSALPNGFKSIYQNRHRLLITGAPVESQMFSDGLFSFSVYVAKADNFSVPQQLVRQGRRTLHSHVEGDTEIIVVGDIPPLTAKKIAESVRFDFNKSTHQESLPTQDLLQERVLTP